MLGANAADASTSLLYAGEQYDSSLQQYYLRARYYNPANGTFNRTDPFAGNMQDPQSLHKYLYCHANPVNNVDPTGLFSFTEMLCVAGIVGCITAIIAGEVMHAKGYAQEQINRAQWKWFVIGAGAGAAIYGTIWITTSMLVALYGASAGFGNLQYAKEYGIRSYNELREVVRGTGLFRHHIIEARFAREPLGLKSGKMLSIIVDKAEHLKFTSRWRDAVAYGTNYAELSAQELWVYAQQVYKGFPALLEAARIQLFGG
jgi:RHS repeat-associated protein